MNLKQLTATLLETVNEIEYLRSENAELRLQVAEYRDREREQYETNMRNAANILTTLTKAPS
jgi:hypothetical protein